MDSLGALSSITAIDANKDKKVQEQQQPQVAFINTIFEGFGNSSGQEASFNA